jgi:hypothetical protein
VDDVADAVAAFHGVSQILTRAPTLLFMSVCMCVCVGLRAPLLLLLSQRDTHILAEIENKTQNKKKTLPCYIQGNLFFCFVLFFFSTRQNR